MVLEVRQKFLLDGMLGKLARWLRILGYDTLFRLDFADKQLLKIAASERRVLITRDRDLHRKAILNNLQSILLSNGKLTDWLAYLKECTGLMLKPEENEPRCSICNASLEPADPGEMDKKVPAAVFARRDVFWRCGDCGKIYWRGTHWENMKELLSGLNQDLTGDR